MVKVSSSSAFRSALENRVAHIELEPGNYFVSGLNIRANGTVIQSTDPANRARIICSANSSSDMLLASGVSGITLKDLILDGNFRNQSGAVRGSRGPRLARFRNCSNVLVQRVHMCNGALDGFRFDTLKNSQLLDNTCELLGHDAFYLIYGCSNVLVKGNKFDINTNSGTRVSMGGTDITIEDNEYFSRNITTSTGPCIEVDKQWGERGIGFRNIVIKNNRMHDTEGSGIWAFMDAAGKVENFQIIGNTIDRTGQYDSGYNGYSNAGIATGRIPAVIEGNTISNVPNALIVNEFRYPGTETYTIQFNNNTIKDCMVGFRVDTPRGYVKGSNNSISGVRTLRYGQTENVVLTESDSPIENTTDSKEIITAMIKVTDAAGNTGSQTLDITTSTVDPRANGLALITCKMSVGGRYGTKNVEFPCDATAPETKLAETCTGTDLLVEVKLSRANGHSGTVQFLLPTIEAAGGYNQLKIRTADGRYGEGTLSIVLTAPTKPVPETEAPAEPTEPEPPNEVIPVKKVKSTIIAMTPKGKLLHVTHVDTPATSVAVGNGTTMDVEIKLLVDDTYYAAGKVALKLVKR